LIHLGRWVYGLWKEKLHIQKGNTPRQKQQFYFIFYVWEKYMGWNMNNPFDNCKTTCMKEVCLALC
jgi:hypothetical protein